MMACFFRFLGLLLLARSSAVSGECDVSEEGCEGLPRIAYLITAHDDATLRASARLLETIYDSENYYFIHIDAKYKTPDLSALAAMVGDRSNVAWEKVHDVRWARWSMIEPTLWGMRLALKSDFDVFINLSGDSWPVLTQPALRRRLSRLSGLNFVTSAPSCPTGLRPTGWTEFGDGWHKKQAYPHPMLEAVPSLEAHYGSQWMILSREFVDYVIASLEVKGTVPNLLRAWFLDGWVHIEGVGKVKPHIPDETFFPSVLMHSAQFNSTAPAPVESVGGSDEFMTASHYIRMDEHYPWASQKQRYKSRSLEKPERPWGPYYLGAYDLGAIRQSQALFVRKVSDEVDPSIFTVLPVNSHAEIPNIDWPPVGMSLTDPPKDAVTVKRGKDSGCIRVAESIHCPPTHKLKPDVAASETLLASL